MVRLVVSFFALLAGVFPAMAGDRALLEVIGYSEDARYFAFEEFGIQDGSGFPYSSIYIIDLSTDSWVVGTPFQLVGGDDSRTLQQIRAAVLVDATQSIEEFGIDVPAEMVAMVGEGVPDSDATSLRFGAPGYDPGAVNGNSELRLSTFVTTALAPCGEWFSIDPLGYELSLTDGDNERVIHRDGALPRSRGCPTAYRLYGVALPFMAQSSEHAVALISVYPGGFEGPDRRFIAVPLGL
ncbi:Predicted secreted protein [Devosia psychrophila]|uniref:Predicted secreted protein n=2 Tax=Devosia psychrophila TaxID=728005 RepID=A0A1I1P0Q2_9HYPH|nr:Predicted secreted protein [Devosia psychrophila]